MKRRRITPERMPRKKKRGALVEGSKAFANGLELKDNPYDPSEQANFLWELTIHSMPRFILLQDA